MAVHGSDSVHMKYNIQNDSLEILWGESKLYQQLSTAFDKAINSISEFTTSQDGRIPKERDIDIIKDHPNITDPRMKEALCEYFDPYTQRSNRWKEIYCCLIGFDFELYKNIRDLPEDQIVEYFKAKYIERASSAHKLFAKKIAGSQVCELTYNLILLPFESLKNFRKEFFTLLNCLELYKPDDDE